MEKVQHQEATPEVFENDIALYLSEFCQEQGIGNMKKEPQSVWNGALMYIRRHVFSVPGILKISKPLEGYTNTHTELSKSNCNSYDISLINNICDYYIYLCMMYDKEVSLMGFSNLTGINIDTFIDWGNNVNKLSTSGCEIYKKLRDFREESLSNKLVTGRQNPVGVLGVLNRFYGWSAPGIHDSGGTNKALGLEEIKNQLRELTGGSQKLIDVVQNAQTENDDETG